jgi:AraC-like DNA-binding protein
MGNNNSKKIIRIRSIPSTEAKNNLLYVQEIGYLPSHLARESRINQIDSYVVMLVVKGMGYLNYNSKEYKICEGQCAYLDCKVEHSYRCDPENPWEVLWLHFNGVSASYYYQKFRQSGFNICLSQSTGQLISIAYEIIANNAHKSNHTEILNAKLITNILTILITGPGVHIESEGNQMKNILDYINSHFTENINLDNIASTFFMNKYQITREFKKEYGETIFQHIIKRRIDYAKELLVTTDKTIEEISLTCGFNDQSYFSRQFKKITGESSLAYRKGHKTS